MSKKILVFLLSLFLFNSLFSQDLQFNGSKFFHFYSGDFIGSSSQIWSISQDSRGVMYFGATTELVAYNGRDWRIYSVKNKVVRSIDRDKNGKLYVGTSGDFGYFLPNQLGEFEFTSLKYLVPDSLIFSDIWKTVVDDKNDAVYFISVNYIFYYKDNSIKVIKNRMAPQFAFKMNDEVILLPFPQGPSVLDGDTLKKLDGIDKITPLYGFVNCLQYSKDTLMILSTSNGVFLYDVKSDSVQKFNLDKNIFSYISSNKGSIACRLNDNEFAVGTFYGGVIVFNKKGELVNVYDAAKGLPTDCIYSLYSDENNNLWAGSQKGVIQIETSSPITYFDQSQNMNSYGMKSIVFKNRFYLGTLDSLFYLPSYRFSLINNNHSFKSIAGTESMWDNLVYKNHLFYSGRGGVFEIIDSSAIKVFNDPNTILCLGASDKFDNVVFIGYKGGLIASNYDSIQKKLIKISDFEDLNYEIQNIVPDKQGNLWLSTNNHGLLYVKFNGDSLNDYSLSLYDERYFEAIDEIKAFFLNDSLNVLTTKGIYKPVFDNNTDTIIKFVHNNFWGKYFTVDSMKIRDILQLDDTTYIFNADSLSFYILKDNSFYLKTTPFKRLPDVSQISSFKNFIFISTPIKFYVFEINKYKDYKKTFSTLISSVKINSDSVIFSGNFYDLNADSVKILTTNQTKFFIPTLKYDENSISFEFTSTDFQDEKNTEYSYILEGFEDEWHVYSKEYKAVYTNLKEGDYVFKVVAKNIYGNLGQISSYSFKILPPWYRTWWAFLFFGVLSVLFIIFIIRLYTNRLKRKNIKLEKTVTERTQQIQQKNEELMQQKEEILTQAEELESVNVELKKLTIVAEKTDNAVIIFDENLNIEWVNASFNKIYKNTHSGMNLLKDSSIQNIEEIIDKIKNEKTSIDFTSKRFVNNQEIWLQTTFSPVVDRRGDIEKIIAIETDISEIKNAHKEIEVKNKMINDSLNYALTIQQSILPSKKILNQYFNVDILFRPKDIVSGDFYWFTEKYSNVTKTKYKTFLAVADCTGHGVPGAFMSLITSRLLDEIINAWDIIDTSQILLELSKRITLTLRQQDNFNHDGVDLALCRFTKDENDNNVEMVFSGAKRPYFYYDGIELKRIKGDRTSIGGVQVNKNFTNKIQILKPNDVLFFMSDGFADQNNVERKKIGSYNFAKIIKRSIDKPIDEQITALELYLNKWQQGTTQRDDIVVVGIKI